MMLCQHETACDVLQVCAQVAPHLQMIVCREEALDMPRLSTAETCLPPLPDDAAFQLLVSGASKVGHL